MKNGRSTRQPDRYDPEVRLQEKRALNVPFKGARKASGVGDNAERLGRALEAFSTAAISAGIAWEKKQKKDQMDAQLKAELMVATQGADADTRAGLLSAEGDKANPLGELYTNDKRLTEALEADALKQDEWRKGQGEAADGWTKEGEEEFDEDGGRYRPRVAMTNEDIDKKWANWTAQAVRGYTDHSVYDPQVDRIVKYAAAQKKADMQSLFNFNRFKIISGARQGVLDQSRNMLRESARMQGSTPESISKIFAVNMERTLKDLGGQDITLSNEQRLALYQDVIGKLKEDASTDPEIAASLELWLPTGTLPNGAIIRDHPTLGKDVKSALVEANKTLLNQELKAQVAAAKRMARDSGQPYDMFMTSDVVVTRANAYDGEEVSLDKKSSEIVKELIKDDESNIKSSMGANKATPAEITKALAVNANKRGYVSPYIEGLLSGNQWQAGTANDPAAQARATESLFAYRAILAHNPGSLNKYVKDARSRNFFQAVDAYLRMNGNQLPASVVFEKVRHNLDEDGRVKPFIKKADFDDWASNNDDLSGVELEQIKDMYNMTYRDVSADKLEDNREAFLNDFASKVRATGFALNGKRVPIPDNVLRETSITKEKFDELTTEMTKDVLRHRGYPNLDIGQVTIVRDSAGTGFYLYDAKGNMLRDSDNKGLHIAFKSVMPHHQQKMADIAARAERDRKNKAVDLVYGRKTPVYDREITGNTDNPSELPELEVKLEDQIGNVFGVPNRHTPWRAPIYRAGKSNYRMPNKKDVEKAAKESRLEVTPRPGPKFKAGDPQHRMPNKEDLKKAIKRSSPKGDNTPKWSAGKSNYRLPKIGK